MLWQMIDKTINFFIWEILYMESKSNHKQKKMSKWSLKLAIQTVKQKTDCVGFAFHLIWPTASVHIQPDKRVKNVFIICGDLAN